MTAVETRNSPELVPPAGHYSHVAVKELHYGAAVEVHAVAVAAD